MFRGCLVLSLLAASSWTACGAQITLSLSGTEFEGGPAFVVALGDNVVGEGTLEAIPSDTPGLLFSFEVADDLVWEGGPLSVKLTNDKATEGAGDRNLFIRAATVGPTSLSATDFQIENGDAARPPGHLYRDREVAIAMEPADGWWPNACDASGTVSGFVLNQIEPKFDQVAELSGVLTQADGRCRAVLTGYSSTGGSLQANLSVSERRATAVLQYLADNGARFASTEVIAGGPTTEFGSTALENRRVIVQLGK